MITPWQRFRHNMPIANHDVGRGVIGYVIAGTVIAKAQPPHQGDDAVGANPNQFCRPTGGTGV